MLKARGRVVPQLASLTINTYCGQGHPGFGDKWLYLYHKQ
jgi:hypothetical protein